MKLHKEKTTKELEQELKKEQKKYKKVKHREELQSQLKNIREARKKLRHKRFKRKYGSIIEGLKTAEKETEKGLKFLEKHQKKPKKKKKKQVIKW